MKTILVILIVCSLVGCSKKSPGEQSGSAQTPITQKLQAMTPAQRTEYAKTHMDEITASAGIQAVPHK